MPTDALYFEAAKIVSTVSESKGTIRSLCFGSSYNNKKALLALVSETCKRKPDNLEYVFYTARRLEVSGVRRREIPAIEAREKGTIFILEPFAYFKWKISSKWLAYVLLQDFLFKKSLSCHDKMKECIIRHKSRLNSEFVKAKIKLGDPALMASNHKKTFKYVRVNALKSTTERAIQNLKKCGFNLVETPAEVEKSPKAFCIDEHIANLLVFPDDTNLSKNELYASGVLVIQDKASSMPAFILNPPVGSKVIDSCSAPGNKTSHLAAIVGMEGKVFAFERDERRHETLVKMLKTAGCSQVETTCGDFLSIDPTKSKYKDVEYCLVDPSCSGSGIIKDHENISEKPSDKQLAERLSKLSSFQQMIIRHAMKFPNVKKLVYSTCSIHEEENEMVVQEILEREPSFQLVSNPLPTWKRRGLSKYPFSQDVIRADPVEDNMHGFFVALFEKKPLTAQRLRK